MAVYNGADYYGTTSIHHRQTYSIFALLLGTICSQDDTVSLRRRFSQKHPGKIKLLRGTENLGALGNFARLSILPRQITSCFLMLMIVGFQLKIEDSVTFNAKNEAVYGKETPLLFIQI